MTQKVAYVTGGMGGIGTTMCQRLHKDGFKVIAGCGPSRDHVKWLGEQKALGFTFYGSVGNVSDWDSTVAAFEKVMAEYGTVDVLVNNAAINPPVRTILDDSLEDWRRTISINLEAVYMGSKLVAPHMVSQNDGRIIHVASIQGFASSGECGAYNAAKGGIIAFTKSMAVELGRYNILVNAVAPGFMVTPMSVVNGVDETTTPDFIEWYVDRRKIPIGRSGLPEDVSGTVVFLASGYCRYMTGQLLVVDGGLMSTF